MPGKSKTVAVVGRRHGKIDLDRVGYFDDGVTGPFDEYRGAPARSRGGASTGGQILAGPRADLFEKKFERVFAGEALSEGRRRAEGKKRVSEFERNVAGRAFQAAAGPAKRHSTPNDFFGCFGDASSLDHAPHADTKGKEAPGGLPNCKIKPNPLGGPGYADICLSPYPTRARPDPYEAKTSSKEREGRFLTASVPRPYFPPDPYKSTTRGPTYAPRATSGSPVIPPGRIYVPGPKGLGGCKAGCFDRFPRYESSPYEVAKIGKKTANGTWLGGYPPVREKYTRSVIDYGTSVSCNANNYAEYKERIYPLRF